MRLTVKHRVKNVMDHSDNMLIQNIVVTACMGIMSVQDIRQRKVSMWLIFLLGATGSVLLVVNLSGAAWPDWSHTASDPDQTAVLSDIKGYWQSYLAGVLPGAVLWMAGKVSGNRIGSGDGYVLMALGLHLGLWNVVNCLLYGSVFCAIAGAVLLALKKKNKQDALPFLPFLTAGYIITIL